MASTDATPVPVKNQAYRVTFPLFDNDGDLVTGAAGLDSEVSTDGGTFADCTNEATEIATASGMYYLDLTAGEMNADTVVIIVKTTTTDAKTTPLVLYPQANGLDLAVNVTHWNGTAVATPTTAGVPEVDVTFISGDGPAADNLEALMDGTGYVDDTAPASRLQVENIGAASGGAINFAPIEDNTGGAVDPSSAAFVGSVAAGTFANVGAGTATHSIDDTGNDIDIVYGYQVGGGRIATTITILADVDGNSDTVNAKVYDHVGATWVTVGTIAQDTSLNVAIESKFTGTGAELGKVYIRFETDVTTPSNLEITNAIVSAVSIGQSVGYANGAIWVDTVNGVAGTENFVNGTADSPSLTWADALTLSSNLGIRRFVIITGSSITLTAAITNYEILGTSWTLAFGGQSIDGAKIMGAAVSGTFTSDTAILEQCIVNAITGPGMTLRSCYFNEVTITNNGTGTWYINDCRSRVAGSGSFSIDYGSGIGATEINLRDYSGGIEMRNMATGDIFSMEGNGHLKINANCTGGSGAVRGIIRISDSANGAVEITPTVPTITQVHQGKAQAGSSNTITLSAAASATNGAYDPGIITLVTGPGAGESRLILEYDGGTKVAVVDKDWRTNPTVDTSYIINSTGGQSHVNEGLATGGGSSTITLNSGASSIDDYYIGQLVFLKSGTGQDQSRIVIDYDGGTKIATVHRAWETNPSTDTGYVMMPNPGNGELISSISTSTDAILVDTGTSIPALIAALENISAAQVNTEMDTALADYDGPTRAELTTDINSVLAILGTPAGASIAADLVVIDGEVGVIDGIVDAILVDTGTSIPALIAALENISAAQVNTEMDTALADYDSPTRAELTTDINSVLAILGTPAGASLAADLVVIDGVVDSILVDTDTSIPALIAALENISATQVNAEVVDALATDTYAEPTGVPGATVALATKIGFLYMALRNQITVTATKKTYFDDSGAAEWEKDLSDDGTTYTETEGNAI